MKMKYIASKVFAGLRLFDVARRSFGWRFGGYVLAFHNLPGAVFERQIEALAPDQPVSLSEMVDRQVRGESTCGLFAITVDDGVATTVRELSDVCNRRGWPVTFFLPSGYLDQPDSMAFQWKHNVCRLLPRRTLTFKGVDYDLSRQAGRQEFVSTLTTTMYTKREDEFFPVLHGLANEIVERGLAQYRDLRPPAPIGWDEVRVLSRDSHISFGSHSVTHNALSALSPERILSETVESQARIQEHSGKSCDHFCYPYGGDESIGKIAPGILARNYRSASTMTRGRLVGRDMFLLTRITFYDEDGPDEVRLKVMTW